VLFQRIQGVEGPRIQVKSKKHSKRVTYILLAKNLGFIDKRELGTRKKDIAEIEKMLKALIKSLENKPSNPWTLFSN
jgi:hypothetical protein